MSLEQSVKEEIYEQLKCAVKHAQRQCNSITYNSFFGDPYFEYLEEWHVIEHILSNGLCVYTVVSPDWYNANATIYYKGYRRYSGEGDLRRRINYCKPYPYINQKGSRLTITTVISPYPLYWSENIGMTRYYKNINFMIPEEAEKPVLIYNNFRDGKEYDESFRIVLGARHIANKKVLIKKLHCSDGGKNWWSSHYDNYRTSYPAKEVILEYEERDKYDETIDIYGSYLDENHDYWTRNVDDAKNIVDAINATLESAERVQQFSRTEVLNNIRKLNEMLGINDVLYPDEVEKLRIKEKKEFARERVEELEAQKAEQERKLAESQGNLAELQRAIDEEKKIFDGYGDR